MKGKKKKKPSVTRVIVALSLLLVALVTGLFILDVIPSKTFKPVYEEDNSTSGKFRSVINKVDHLVYESLYKEGVKEEDISFSKVIPKHDKNLDWDFTELTVLLDDHGLINSIEKLITKKISGLRPDVSSETIKVSNDQVDLNIRILGRFTHRLKLKYKTNKKTGSGELPKVAIIIDDIGYDVALAASFSDLGIPICLSILPNAPYSKKIAVSTVKKGGEILLHLPMEPKGYPEVNPGDDALMISMDGKTIQRIVNNQILKIPGLKGVNHHMGSLFSEDYIKMKYVLDEVKKFDLYYVDSRTTTRSVAYKVAKELGVPVAEKNVFLDNDLSEKALKYQVERLMGIARSSGSAIGIGHPHKETVDILKKYRGQLIKNYKVVPVSNLVK